MRKRRKTSRGHGTHVGGCRRQRGALYVVSLLFTLMLALAGATMLMRAVSETGLSDRSRSQYVSLHLAEAAVDRAGVNLRTPADLTDDVNSGTLPTGSFSIDTPPTQVATNLWKVTAHGTSSGTISNTTNMEAVFQIASQSVFQFAMFGKDGLTVSGSATTNSYNSSLGPYNGDAGAGHNADHNGNVGTNSTATGGVTVSGSIFVDGQVSVGPGVSNPTSVVTGYNPSFITGDPKVASMSSAFSMPAVTVPAGLTCSDYTVNGNSTTTLSPGTYCYHNLTLSGNSTLTSSGAVTIYLTGSLTASGNSTFGVVNDPTQTIVLMTPASSATIQQGDVTGDTSFYGGIYGPNATFTISGSAEVFGSIVADRVSLSGSADIHYDKSLINNTSFSGNGRTSLRYWKKL